MRAGAKASRYALLTLRDARDQYGQESEWVHEASKEQSLSKRRLCTEAKAGNDSGHKGFTLLKRNRGFEVRQTSAGTTTSIVTPYYWGYITPLGLDLSSAKIRQARYL